METLFQQILNLLTLPPGNLIYHLVLAFAVVASLQAAWIGRQTGAGPHSGRLLFGLGMLLLGQAVLFLSSGFAWQGILDEHLFLPPLDRAVMLFGLIWIVWLWNFPAPARLADLVAGFLNLGVVLLFLFTFTSWRVQGAGQSFNNSWLDDWVWELAALLVSLTGMALLLFTRPAGWGFGLGMLGLCLAGVLADVFITLPGGDFSGYLRLGQLAAFPMLTALLTRSGGQTPVQARIPAGSERPSTPSMVSRQAERRRYSVDPRTLHAWLALLNASAPDQVLPGIAKAVAQTMLSDLCFIVSTPEFGYIALRGGYDLIREEPIEGTMLEQGQLPALLHALQRGKALRITQADPQPADLKTLSTAFGLKEAGSLLFLPLVLEEEPQGGFLFLSPYSNRQWSQDDQGFLTSELEVLARMLHQAQTGAPAAPERASEAPSAELEALRLENQGLRQELAGLRQSATLSLPGAAPAQDLNALVALQQEAQEQIASLLAENERLQVALDGQGSALPAPDGSNRMEDDLRATLREIAHLQNQLAEAHARNLMLDHEIRLASGESHNHPEIIASIVQEIRQPMASIVGYTDLLLAETVGILGALQRKFLERVKASSERMRSMLDDLVQVTGEGDRSIELSIKPVDIGLIIDSAVADTSAQLREKNIALLVDLPEDLPEVSVDRDAIQQIVLHLLQNASGATPQDGTITLRARMQEEREVHYLMLQVTDTGGGVALEDLPRVFTRRYRADLPLIQGLGDTGIGLSIAKTLVEAHGGRIWVESVADQSTTISVLAPIHLDAHLQSPQ